MCKGGRIAPKSSMGCQRHVLQLKQQLHFWHQHDHYPHHPHQHGLSRKAAGAILSTHCPSIDSSVNQHHHNHQHSRRSLSASPSFHDANVWMSSDLTTSGATTNNTTTGCGQDDRAKGEFSAINNNNNNNNSGLFLEPDLRTFRDALAVRLGGISERDQG